MARLLGLSLLAGLVLLFVVLFAADAASTPSDFKLFVGRFHSALVHLPVGILLLAVLLEVASGLSRTTTLERAVPAVLFIGAWAAIAAAIAGLYLSQGGGYDGATLAWHQRLGVGTAVLATAAYVINVASSTPRRFQRAYAGLLAVLVVVVSVGGHLGGELTHGAGYLTRYMPDGVRSLIGLSPRNELGRLHIEDFEDASTFAGLIQPILVDRCVACHSPDLGRGGLLLDSPTGILDGGDTGPIVVAGRADESEIIRRLWLPPGNDDHMPPEGRPQLTVAEAELIRWWIDQGASFEQTLAAADITPTVQAILDGYGLDEIPTGIFALDVSPPEDGHLDALRALGITAMPLGEGEPFLHVRCARADTCAGPQMNGLLPVARQVAWLDLGRTHVSDSGLAVVSSLEHLTRLHLELTPVTDAALVHLEGLQYLEYLNLYGTNVTDDGLERLADLPALRVVYLWQTQVTEAGARRLRQARPDLEVNLGGTR